MPNPASVKGRKFGIYELVVIIITVVLAAALWAPSQKVRRVNQANIIGLNMHTLQLGADDYQVQHEYYAPTDEVQAVVALLPRGERSLGNPCNWNRPAVINPDWPKAGDLVYVATDTSYYITAYGHDGKALPDTLRNND